MANGCEALQTTNLEEIVMCGIAGVRKFGKAPITGEEIVLLLCSLEKRGPHATGIALMDSKGISVHKAPQPAWQYTKSKDFEKFLNEHLTEDTYTALLHTRFATVGNPDDNKNNHPMFDGKNAIVHNGSIRNSEWLFNQGKFPKSCETDSDIVRALVANYGITAKGVREMNKMQGSGAIACVSEEQPGVLLLARSGNPLVYGFDKESDKLYWASELQAISQASRPWYQYRGAWVQDTKTKLAIGSMPDNTAWIFGDQKLEFHSEFKVCTHFTPPDYSASRGSYHGKDVILQDGLRVSSLTPRKRTRRKRRRMIKKKKKTRAWEKREKVRASRRGR
jgi:predicted glutamine amidotransferase